MFSSDPPQCNPSLDALHFLAPKKIFLGSAADPLSCLQASTSHSPTSSFFTSNDSSDTATLASADFDVDVRSGFLSPSPPLKRLTDPKYAVWEETLEATRRFIPLDDRPTKLDRIMSWKSFVDSELPVLKTESLRADITELRRAHLILAFLTHTYVHCQPALEDQVNPNQNKVIIPCSLSIPFFEVSQALDMPPVLTYADTVLYNWDFKDPALGFAASNIDIPTTFTQSESEKHFFRTSVLVEALGPQCLALMRSSLDEAFMADQISMKRIGRNLKRLSEQIDCISEVLSQVTPGCDPKTFYWDIRPWFNGGKWVWEGVRSDLTTKGKLQEGGTEASKWRVTDFGGPSAGQSTLIHAIDIFLGVDHHPNHHEVSTGIEAEETFMDRMSNYMPHHHRLFLQHLSRSCSTNDQPTQNLIRSMVTNHEDVILGTGSNLKENYNLCIRSLENLRKTHMQIVTLFIICQKNSSNPSQLGLSMVNDLNPSEAVTSMDRLQQPTDPLTPSQLEPINKDQVDSGLRVDSTRRVDALKGTGGTNLSKFLKRCKLRTSQALID